MADAPQPAPAPPTTPAAPPIKLPDPNAPKPLPIVLRHA